MIETLGFPLDLAFAMSAIAVIYLLAILSPVLLAAVIAWRQHRTMKRRILFVGSVMVACYGLIALFLMAIAVPVGVFAVFVVSPLKELGYLEHSFVLAAIDFTYSWWWLLLPAAILISATLTSRYLANRWNRIIEALNG